jgi:predicted transposase YdaD
MPYVTSVERLGREEGRQEGPQEAWQEAVAAGFDMTQVAQNLRRTVWERIQRHSRAARMAALLREAPKKDA